MTEINKIPQALREALDAPLVVQEGSLEWEQYSTSALGWTKRDRARTMAAFGRWILSDDWTTAEVECAVAALDAEASP